MDLSLSMTEKELVGLMSTHDDLVTYALDMEHKRNFSCTTIVRDTLIILGRSAESFNFSSSEEIHLSLANSFDSIVRSAIYVSIFSVCQGIGDKSKAYC
jgi:hypothetical protein